MSELECDDIGDCGALSLRQLRAAKAEKVGAVGNEAARGTELAVPRQTKSGSAKVPEIGEPTGSRAVPAKATAMESTTSMPVMPTPPDASQAGHAAVEHPPDESKLVPGGWGEAAVWAMARAAESGKSSAITPALNRSVWNRTLLGSGHGAHGNVVVLYHQTSRMAAHLILKNGFRPGRYGWCGGGIYFATSPEATYRKAIGPESQKGYIIAAKVDVGRVQYFGPTCGQEMSGPKLLASHHDSIKFNPGDGTEFVVYSSNRVLAAWHHHR